MARTKNRVKGNGGEAKSGSPQKHKQKTEISDRDTSSNTDNTQTPSHKRTSVLLSFVVAMVVPFAAVAWLQIQTEKVEEVTQKDLDLGSSISRSQKWSLFEPYAVDYNILLKDREDNMKKYNYNYDINGVDKRSNLSLQEYFDVYDAKW